ncbi:M15 family metallopeptidase [Streptomyces sp. 7-21]|uniref:M15 family metallopeptidase n=1 Tax=Streptomyces sp. 7-21 TaxID=2802283 RepID=UPI00191DFF15|nr:M15 family metallopeptidase [Streptomyces sp. 7-21]MBL1067153.1 M15 family metallopeptidase [Streptomyces sp. 7-21]
MKRLPSALRTAVPITAALLVATTTPAQADPEPKAPEDFVALADIDPTILHDIRYHTAHNFVGEPIDGYNMPLCILTRDAAQALSEAQETLRQQGYTLKVYDCYRPQRAVDQFVEWAEDLDDQRMRDEFYPRVDKSRLFEDGYIAENSGHSRGSTVDLTLVQLPAAEQRPYIPGEPLTDCAAPQDERFPDNSIDMGTGFDCFDTLSHTLDPRIQGEQRTNRQLLKKTLEDVGFVNYDREWWHFTYTPEAYPDTYFNFPVHRRSLTP